MAGSGDIRDTTTDLVGSARPLGWLHDAPWLGSRRVGRRCEPFSVPARAAPSVRDKMWARCDRSSLFGLKDLGGRDYPLSPVRGRSNKHIRSSLQRSPLHHSLLVQIRPRDPSAVSTSATADTPFSADGIAPEAKVECACLPVLARCRGLRLLAHDVVELDVCPCCVHTSLVCLLPLYLLPLCRLRCRTYSRTWTSDVPVED